MRNVINFYIYAKKCKMQIHIVNKIKTNMNEDKYLINYKLIIIVIEVRQSSFP